MGSAPAVPFKNLKSETMLKASPVEEETEEYAIHDHEGFDGYPIGEYERLESAHKIACFIEEHGNVASELLNQFNGDIFTIETAHEEVHIFWNH